MRDFENSLRFTQELMWIILGMVIIGPLELYYLFIKGFHTYLLQTLGVFDDPLGMIRLSKALLVGLGMIVPLYGATEALSDLINVWDKYVR